MFTLQGRTAQWGRTVAFCVTAFLALGQHGAADPTDICTRWSVQSALVNGTIYIYGGRSTDEAGQTQNTWNNNFSSIDVSKTWKISSPTIKDLDQPSGPPPVANGYLWHSYDSLFLYGGEYSDSPVTSPSPFALWEYNIGSSKWIEHKNPKTSDGKNSDGGNQPVQAAAEGAGISVPPIGRGFYFGGHLDGYTTAGWSQSIERVYLKSMVEFTFPGATNDGVNGLKSQGAGKDGAWRNITTGGLQDTKGFTERADGVLVWVPGFSAQGMILGLAGGTNQSFTEMNVIDVYDVASSTWYKQATSGPSPPIRVNPCAVAASAADGSSTNIYLYGGQNLVPYKEQIQYDDMWILSVPSFFWIKVDTSKQSTPPARAGHSCEVWDGQMVVVGGYVGTNISCDSPGVYVFDMSNLTWANEFHALSGANQQAQQAAQAESPVGLAGSFGYQVPDAVQSAIGGGPTGGATITTPAAGAATAGPLATGSPVVYTVTGADGATVTETAGSSGGRASSGPNVAAIVAGVVAGVCFAAACYLGFCAVVYRRQLKMYQAHVAASQRAAIAGPLPTEKTAFMASTEPPSSSSGRAGDQTSSGHPSNQASSGNRAGGGGAPTRRSGSDGSSTEDLLQAQEPSFVGVLLSPRRSLRVINH